MKSPPSTYAAPGPLAPVPARSPIAYLILRLHFYIGLLIGPFLLIAASSGLLYALTPQIEDNVYADQLFTSSRGETLPLARQIEAARDFVGGDAAPVVVRPAPEPGTTTRVMFDAPGKNGSHHRAIFVDPITADIKGDLPVYGTSGVLPVRAWIDLFHRELQLGQFGRWYSELAASWLWLAALGGLVLWIRRGSQASQGHRVRRWHGRLGVWAMLGFIFFSVTGLTWSQYAGSNIGVLRAHYGWGTPGISTALTGPAQPEGEHAHHGAHAPQTEPTPALLPASDGSHAAPAAGHATHGAHAAAQSHAHHALADAHTSPGRAMDERFDRVLAAARAEGLTAGRIEVRRATRPDRAWSVVEIDRRWPTQVDAAAIDPATFTVIDRTRFETFPIAAKLTRWGIDAHMGVLFGWVNQLVLIAFALALITMIIWGYAMWWRRRPTKTYSNQPRLGLIEAIEKVSLPGKILCLAVAVALGLALPVMGVSLLAILAVDGALSILSRYRRASLSK